MFRKHTRNFGMAGRNITGAVRTVFFGLTYPNTKNGVLKKGIQF